MLFSVRYRDKKTIVTLSSVINLLRPYSTTSKSVDEEEFRQLNLRYENIEEKKTPRMRFFRHPPRVSKMSVDQDWPSVWPTARTFHPDSVPLPLYQGYPKKNCPPPNKYSNTELLKIPNFLHLTPPAIKRHCEAIKKFCTKWPKELDATIQDKFFPIEIISSDYLYSSPTIRDPLARIITLRIKLSNLKLDSHAKDKLLRLVGNRYDPKTDILTITADRCPVRKQNYEYVKYLLTALYHESWHTEPWESEKSEEDMEYYDWDRSVSRKNLVTLYKWPEPPKDLDYQTIPQATEYKMAVSDLINNGENPCSVNKYKETVKNLLKFNSNKEH